VARDLLCLLRLHSWQRRVAPRTSGNGTYFVCRRCGRERTLQRSEGVWGVGVEDPRR
jgi:hypothetical protein